MKISDAFTVFFTCKRIQAKAMKNAIVKKKAKAKLIVPTVNINLKFGNQSHKVHKLKSTSIFFIA